MRLNQFLAHNTSISRRQADSEIINGQVKVNGQTAKLGQIVNESDEVLLNGALITSKSEHNLVMLNKPVGYIVSRDGQGSKTIYDLLPDAMYSLKPIGRLDKDSTGLLLMTDDGNLAFDLTHPSQQKEKYYQLALDKPIDNQDARLISSKGVKLEDGISKFDVKEVNGSKLLVILKEGRNRQIRHTFNALGYKVIKLHRISFGDYQLDDLEVGKFKQIDII